MIQAAEATALCRVFGYCVTVTVLWFVRLLQKMKAH